MGHLIRANKFQIKNKTLATIVLFVHYFSSKNAETKNARFVFEFVAPRRGVFFFNFYI